MIERILIGVVLVLGGILVYQAILLRQRRQVAATLGQSRATRPQLLVFTSPTCGACKLQQIPIVEKMKPVWGDKIQVQIVDVTEEPEIASKYGVWSLPTTIVVDGAQQIVAINQGVAEEKQLREQFVNALRGIVPVTQAS